MKLFIYNVWIVILAADAFSAALAGLYLKQLHDQLGNYLAWALFGVSLEALRTVLIATAAPQTVTPVIWVIVTAMLIRAIKSFLVIRLVLFLYRVRHKLPKGEHSI